MSTEQDVTFPAGEELLSGRFVRPDTCNGTPPQILFLHGAGKASKERCLPIARRLLAEYSLSSFAFDFSGHGASSGTLQGSSLRKRVEEAVAALEYAEFSDQTSLCSFSMGGHVALELARLRKLQSLILFYPAVYANEAVDLRFGDPRFSAILRSAQSWESSDVFSVLSRFSGNVLIVAGEKDQVISPLIFQRLYANTARANRKRLFLIPDAPHLLLPRIFADDDLYTEICGIIANYVLGRRSV